MDTGLENSVFMAGGRGVDSGALAMHQWEHNDRGQHIQYRKNKCRARRDRSFSSHGTASPILLEILEEALGLSYNCASC